MPSSPDEIFDVVDENDAVVSQATRAHVHAEGLRHRAVHIMVWNPDGQLFLQRRSMTKDQMPGVWTTSASGHVDTGEDYHHAAVRELNEELGIDLGGPSRLQFLFKHPACAHTGNEFIQVFRLTWSGKMTLDPEEIDIGKWLLPSEIDRKIRQRRRMYAPSFRLIWGLVQGYGEEAFFGE